MTDLFSCRNCIHNPGQSMSLGAGGGYCMKFRTVLRTPDETTCKYHHRKDLPHFVVDEARREHAAEFAAFSGVVTLGTLRPCEAAHYSERSAWEHRDFDPVTNAVASYPKAERSWVYIQAFAGGVDGRRALVHGCLTRRYMDQCAKWTSSYRLVLALVQEMQATIRFEASTILPGADEDAVAWDVFFAQVSGLQEYGWHAGIEDLMWATDSLNGALSTLDRATLSGQLDTQRPVWTDRIIRHATDHGAFFTQTRAAGA